MIMRAILDVQWKDNRINRPGPWYRCKVDHFNPHDEKHHCTYFDDDDKDGMNSRMKKAPWHAAAKVLLIFVRICIRLQDTMMFRLSMGASCQKYCKGIC